MRRISPSSCLKDRQDFGFPQEVLGGHRLQKAQAISVFHELVQQLFLLFSTEGSSAAWEDSLLHRLCTGLDQQLTELEACPKQEAELQGRPLLNEDPILAVGDTSTESLSISTREEIQPLCLGDRQSRSHENPFFSETLARKMKQEGMTEAWFNMEMILTDQQDHTATRLPGQIQRNEEAWRIWEMDGSQLRKAQAISVLHEMLQQILNLFPAERSSAACDTTLLDKLRTGLHQQLEDLDTSLVQVMGEQDSAQGRAGPTLVLKSYFQGIHLPEREDIQRRCLGKSEWKS
ncbi:Interferon alpha-4 [Camelus dromedarius]|uniref:Interferon alpha-4 n=1 Tax=Camelus dromedarius TaxID=9838 RepID=A0A5N4EAT9_CAMDR|nr:Interferon alpha-4 [Camelus dromedarius]